MKKYTIITPSLSLTANVLRRKVQCVGEFVSTNTVLIITSLIIDWHFVLCGDSSEEFGKVNPNRGEGPALGFFFCCAGALCPKCTLGALARVFCGFGGSFWGLRG